MRSDDPRAVYADIIDLPYRKNTNRKQMSLYDRAAQFAPFAALSGYDEMVTEEARLTEAESELSDYETELLDRNLFLINEALENNNIPEVTVTYFVPDKHKSGGSNVSITALVKAVDVPLRQLILYGSYDTDNKKVDPVYIDFDRIKSIKGEFSVCTED